MQRSHSPPTSTLILTPGLVSKQCLHSKNPKPSPSMIYISMAWGIPLDNLGQLSWLHPLPISHAPQPSFCWGRAEKRESPSTTQAMPQHCAITTASVTNPEQSSVWKKINSIPARPCLSLCLCSLYSIFSKYRTWPCIQIMQSRDALAAMITH